MRKRVAWSAPMPLQNIKDIGHGADGKVNDVLTAAVAGSLRRYLLAQGQPVEDVNIRALVPVNLRSTEKAFELGNQFGLVFLTLPIGMADPYERLQEVVRRMERLKYSSEAVVIFGLLNGAGMAPAQIERQLIDIFSSKGSAVLTNVPGPRERLHFASIPMRGAMFWVPRAGRIGLGISIFSYADDVLLGVAADVNLVPEPDALITHFEEEFEELKQRFV